MFRNTYCIKYALKWNHKTNLRQNMLLFDKLEFTVVSRIHKQNSNAPHIVSPFKCTASIETYKNTLNQINKPRDTLLLWINHHYITL